MNRITICSPAWKRPDIFLRWVRAMTSLNPRPHIVIAGSKGDLIEQIAIDYGCDYIQAPNKPVGAKWNAAHLRAKDTADYYLTTGSDDVMSQAMWDYYQGFTGDRLVLTDLYFYEPETGRTLYWGGYGAKHRHQGYPIGASQLHSQAVMEKMNWSPFVPNSMAHEHDTEKWCRANGVKTEYVRMADTGGISIDLKSKDSYTKLAMWPNSAWRSFATIEATDMNLANIIR